jgi:hypothetical protein
MTEINYTCSLGSLCHSSQLLKRNKLSSYPFDWIFSNCDNMIHCIEDNFYINTQSICGHSKYNNCMFNHHNPLRNINYYNYNVRCVDIFKELLKKQDHKLFIITFVNMNNIDDNLKNKMIEFNNKLTKYTSNYTLFVIFHIPNKEQNNIFTYNDNIDFLELHTISVSNGSVFVNNNDNIYLDNIIKSKYNFNIKN